MQRRAQPRTQRIHRARDCRTPGSGCRDEDCPGWTLAPEVTCSTRGAPTCPQCGAGMQMRKSARGPFFGCTRFPLCRGTRPG